MVRCRGRGSITPIRRSSRDEAPRKALLVHSYEYSTSIHAYWYEYCRATKLQYSYEYSTRTSTLPVRPYCTGTFLYRELERSELIQSTGTVLVGTIPYSYSYSYSSPP